MHTYFFAKKWSYVWIFSDAKVATKVLVICSLVSCPVFGCFMQKVLQHAKIGPGDFVILFTLSKKTGHWKYLGMRLDDYIVNFVYTFTVSVCMLNFMFCIFLISILLSVPDPLSDAEETLFHIVLFLYMFIFVHL